jgi:hypothetical protein
MGAARTSGTLVPYHNTTWHHSPEDHNMKMQVTVNEMEFLAIATFLIALITFHFIISVPGTFLFYFPQIIMDQTFLVSTIRVMDDAQIQRLHVTCDI